MPNDTSSWSLKSERCKKCRLCVSLCPAGALSEDEDGLPGQGSEGKCRRCGLCEAWCPDFAIHVGGDAGAR